MQPLQNCIGPTILIGREILCLPYAGFFNPIIEIKAYHSYSLSLRDSILFLYRLSEDRE